MTCYTPTNLYILMLSVRLSKDIKEKLNTLAKVTNGPKSFYAKDALEEYLTDMPDYYQAQERPADISVRLSPLMNSNNHYSRECMATHYLR